MLKCVKYTLWNCLNIKQFSRFPGYNINIKKRFHYFTSSRENIQLVVLELLDVSTSLRSTWGGGKCIQENFPPLPCSSLTLGAFPLPFHPTCILGANYLLFLQVSPIVFVIFCNEAFCGFWTPPGLNWKNEIIYLGKFSI